MLQQGTNTHREAGGVHTASLPPIGIHILAFGAKGYTYAACNLAASLRYFTPDVHITVHVGRGTEIPATHAHLFDTITGIAIPPDKREQPDPGYAKANLCDELPDGKSLYIDADSIALKDITPLLIELDKLEKPFAMQVIGIGTKDAPPGYFDWVKPARMSQKYSLSDSANLYGVQSSWMFFEKPRCQSFTDLASACLEDWVLPELKGRWGFCVPDELAYSAACSVMQYDPSGPEGAICFGSKNMHDSVQQLRDEFHLLSIYGQGIGTPKVRPFYLDAYDRVLHEVYKGLDMDHLWKWPLVMRDKYVNSTKR